MAQYQTGMVPPSFVRIEIRQDGEWLTLDVWEADDERYLSRVDHARTYGRMHPQDAYEIIAAVLDGLGLPDPF